MGRAHASDSAGIGGLGLLFGLAGLLVVLLIIGVAVSLTLPSTPSTTTTTTTAAGGTHGAATTAPTTVAGGSGVPSAADVAACESDLRSVQVALAAYQATTGADAAPPAPWSAATYPTNFSPLTDAPAPGPYLKMPPGDNHYVIQFDAAGHVWVEPAGTFSPSYVAANDGSSVTVCTRVAR